MTRHLICLLLCCFAYQVAAQDALQLQEEPPEERDETALPAVEAPTETNDSLAALDSVRESIALVDETIASLREQIKTATEVEAQALSEQILKLVEKRESLQNDFDLIATGIDPTEYDGYSADSFTIRDEIDLLLQPIIQELKDLTEKPREIEQLRNELTRWEQKLETTEAALANLALVPATEAPEDLSSAIADTRTTWESRRQQAETRVQAITYQLEQAERTQPSLLDTAKDSLRSFYRSRGRNFLFSALAFVATLIGLRFVYRQIHKHFPWSKRRARPFYLRLIDVGFSLFSVIGAVVAAVFALYATGDWVLMGITLILLFGVLLGAKNAIPKFYEQGRLLLNLGEIREGERVIFRGIPWEVERLSFYTTLRNPELRGGMVRLPVNQLSGLISRPFTKDSEQWFPCGEGDWIDLADEGKGRVIVQTPEYVQLIKLGGSKVTIPTEEFLSKSPENLSHGFRISSTFGVDYRHQAESTEAIPEKMWAHITRELTTLVGDHDNLVSLKVEFASAGASSL
ncbi:MAG: hypothetical protein AAF236_15835, partial [Verrucomicrobiota bacterium]